MEQTTTEYTLANSIHFPITNEIKIPNSNQKYTGSDNDKTKPYYENTPEQVTFSPIEDSFITQLFRRAELYDIETNVIATSLPKNPRHF